MKLWNLNYTLVDSITRPKDDKIFKVGDLVYWNDPDYILEDKEYKSKYGSLFEGNILQIWIIENIENNFEIQILLTNEKPFALGRLNLNDIEHNKDDIKEYYLADSEIMMESD